MKHREPLAIQYKRTDSLRPDPRNSRKHPPEQIEQLRTSVRRFGINRPLALKDDGLTIGCGNGLWEAILLEGIQEVPTVTITGLTEAEWRAYAIADNRIPLSAGWDEVMLAAELGDLRGLGFDLSLTGFGELELQAIFTPTAKPGADPDEELKPPARPVSVRGDVWRLGQHLLVCGDAENPADVATALDGHTPHLMVTDAPYGVQYDPAWRYQLDDIQRAEGKVPEDHKCDWRKAYALFPGSVAYVWHASIHTGLAEAGLQACGFITRSQIIWRKPHYAISRANYHHQHEPCWYVVRGEARWNGSRKESTVWDIDNGTFQGGKAKPENAKTGHGTQKPVECMARPMRNNSKPGERVYDPFVGSGTSIIAAHMLKRICHAMDNDPAYVDVAVERWQRYVGEEAILAETGETFAAVKARRMTTRPGRSPAKRAATRTATNAGA